MFLLLGWSNLALSADYYWVGGQGNWSDFSTHWATTSNGSTFHPSAPGVGDDIYFDGFSFSLGDTVFVDAPASGDDIRLTGGGGVIFANSPMTFLGEMFITNCWFHLNGNTLSVGSIDLSTYTYLGARRLYWSNSTINITGSGVAMDVSDTYTLVTDFTDAIFNFNYPGFLGVSFDAGGTNIVYSEVNVNSIDFTFLKKTVVDTLNVAAGSALTITAGPTNEVNVENLNFNGDCGQPNYVYSTSSNQAYINIRGGTLNEDYLVLKSINGTNGTFNAVNSIDQGNNSNWLINENPSATNYFWVGGTGNWSDPAHWALASGVAADPCVPGPSDNVVFDANSGTGFTTTVDVHSYCNNMTWVGVLGAPDLTGTNNLTLKGSMVLDAPMTASLSGVYEFVGLGAETITSDGVVLNGDVHFNHPTGSWSILDDLTSNALVQLDSGSFSTATNNMTIDGFISNLQTVRTLDISSSVITLTGVGQTWDINPITLTFTSTASELIVNHTNAGLSVINGGSLTYNILRLMNPKSELNNDNTFQLIDLSPGINFRVEAGSNQTFDSLNAIGLCTSPITIESTNNSSPAANFIKTGYDTLNVDYCQILNVTADDTGNKYNLAQNSSTEFVTTGWTTGVPGAGVAYFWRGNAGDWGNVANWDSPVSGTPALCLPTIRDSVFFDALSFNAIGQTANVDIGANCYLMDWTGSDVWDPIFNLSGSVNVREDIILNPTVIITNTDTVAELRFVPELNTSEFITFDRPVGTNILFNGSVVTDSLILNGTLKMDDESILNVALGTFESSGDSIQTGIFLTSGISAKIINLNNSIVELRYGLNFVDFSPGANQIVLNSGTSHIHLLGSSSTDFFSGDSLAYYDVTINNGGGLSNVLMSGSNTFNDLTLNPGLKLIVDSLETQTVGGVFTAQGTCQDSIFISSSGALATTFDLANPGLVECTNPEGITIATSTPLNAKFSADYGNNTSWNFDPAVPTTAGFNVVYDHCYGDPVPFTNTSTANAGGIGALTFEWDFGDDTLSTDTSSVQDPTYTYTTDGVKYVNLVSFYTNFCSDTLLDSVRINKPVLTFNSSQTDTTICQGDSVAFTASAFAGGGVVTYDYQINNVSVQNSPSPFYFTFGLNNGDVVTCIMTANGCVDTSDVVLTFTVHANPTVNLFSSDADNIICDGDDVIFAGSGSEKYQFFVDNVPVTSLTTNGVYNTTLLTNGQVVTLVGVDTSTSCSTQAPEILTMTVNNLPTVTMTTTDVDLVICAGDVVGFDALGASLYEFYLNGFLIQGPSASANLTAGFLSNLDNITVVGIENGCPATSADNFTYFVNAIPNTLLSNNTGTTICEGVTVNFSAFNATSYEFFVNGVSVQGPSGNSSYSNSVLVAGDQVDVMGESNGCSQMSSTQTFTVNPLPNVTLIADDADSTICQGDTVTFTGGGATFYQFYLNGFPVGPANTNPVYVNGSLANGDIVKVRGIQSGCATFSPTEFPMTVIPQFNVNLFDSDFDDAICFGENIDFTGAGTAITQYELFVDGVSQGTNATGNFPINTLPIGNPQVSLSGSKLGCTYFADDTITISVTSIPTIDMTSSDVDNVICDGDSVIFTANGGTTYEFLINSISQGVTAIDTLFSDGFNNGDVIDLIGYVGGCSNPSLSTFTITVDPVPPTVLSSSDVDNIICEGETITYTASGADNYEFFIGGVSQGPPSPTTVLTSNLFTGTNQIYVEGYNVGCSGTSNMFNLVVNSLPVIDVFISDADTSVCDGENVTITGGGAGTYELMLNGVSQGPATTNNIFNTNSLVDGDQITIQGDGINGCFNTSTDLYTFTVIPNPVVVMTTSEPDSAICVGDLVTFNATGASTYEYYVNGELAEIGANYSTDSLTNGQIVQIFGNDNICSTFGNSIPFSVYSYPVTSIISDDIDETICQGDQVVFTGLGAFDFEFFVNGASVQGPTTQDSLITTLINDGDVILVEGGNNGCVTSSSSITYTVNQFPVTSLTSSDIDDQICFGDLVDFTAGSALMYEFFINGISQDPASTTTVFSTDELNDGDVITVLGYDGECAALSLSTFTMGVDVMPLVLDVVPGNIICVGDQVDFTGTGADTYEFFVDGTSVQGPGAVNTYSSSALTDGQVVSLQGYLAATGCTQWAPTSQLFVVMDNPVIIALGSTTICEGDSVVLQSDYSTWNQWHWDGLPIGGEWDTVYQAYQAGAYHTEVTLGGIDEVWGLGNNVDGQLGDNTINSSLAAVETIGASDIAEIESGVKYNLARSNAGAVFGWGLNSQGQLGDGSFSSSIIPITTSITDAIDIAAGHEFGIAALSTGAVMSWGRNDLGQLGQGNFATTNFPFAIVGLTGIVKVSAGENHTLALKDDGTVFSWGDNQFGQLGLGNQTDSNAPILIPGLSGIESIFTGDNHSFAVDSTGQLFVWGSNAHGQLGVNGIVFSDAPILNTIPNVQAADGGTDHSIVLTTNQKVYTFGNNDYGQLGNGTLISEYNPQKMDTLDAVIHVEAAFYQTGVIKGDNSTWTWGRNNAGQLGTENTLDQDVPNYIPNLTGATDFGLGQDHTSYIVTQENSCASNIIDVFVNPQPDVTITGFGGLLTATPPGDSYQWYIDGILIPGATAQSIAPSTPGWYTCEVTYAGGCTSLSVNQFPWGVVGINELDEFAFTVYPNPSNGIVNIKGDFFKLDQIDIEVVDLLGKTVYTEQTVIGSAQYTLDLDFVARGTYSVRLLSKGELIGTRKVVLH
jgi:alpha-tubulin suppressor-like RCC1 family protein